jgi:hypothetical protein
MLIDFNLRTIAKFLRDEAEPDRVRTEPIAQRMARLGVGQ